MSGRWVRAEWSRFFWRPVLPFALEVLLFAPLALVPEVLPHYLIASPGVMAALAGLNAPLLWALIGLTRRPLDADTRRNHALEHATIHFLDRTGHDVVSGRAERGGFRIFGRLTPSQIHAAFAEVAVRVKGGIRIPCISADCGSNRISALGLGVILLGLATLSCLWLAPPLWARTAALAVAIAVYLRWRDSVGNWIQDRYFMATDFDEVAVRHIRKMRGSNRGGRLLYYVQTRVA